MEIRNKLKAAKINDNQEAEVLGNAWETNFRMGDSYETVEWIEGYRKERVEAIDEWIRKNKSKNNRDEENQDEQNREPEEPQVPQTPQPTQKEIDEARDKLKQSQKEEDIIDSLDKTRDVARNSSDENLKKEREAAEKRLSKEKLREIIRQEVKKELELNGIKPEELTPDIKQKVEELNSNGNGNDQVIRTQIFKAIGQQSLTKIISNLEKALKGKKEKDIATQIKKLKEFISSSVDYKKEAYQLKKDVVNNLLAQAEKQSNASQSSVPSKDKFFRSNNPFLWISGIGIIALMGGVIVVVVRRRKTSKKGGRN